MIVFGRLLAGQSQFLPANFANIGSHDLKLFPANRPATVINIPFPLGAVKLGGDGHTLYSFIFDQHLAWEQMPGITRIEFNPVRSAPINGTQGFGIRDYAVTPDNQKIVIAGRHRERGVTKCGLFEINASTGVARQVLTDDCNNRSSWTDLSVSSDGTRAIANYGNSNTDHNYRLDLIDLTRGSTNSLGDLSRATWSPDGKWIAAIEWSHKRLIVLDTNDFSHRRDLGSTIMTAWSPDSRYLLAWHYHFLRCGIGIDLPPPASFVVFEVASGKRRLIHSSQCQLVSGPIGWMSTDIGK